MNKVSAMSLIMHAGLALYVAALFFLFLTGQNIPQKIAWIGIAAAPVIFMIHAAFWFFSPKKAAEHLMSKQPRQKGGAKLWAIALPWPHF